jgi:hypothetical protein
VTAARRQQFGLDREGAHPYDGERFEATGKAPVAVSKPGRSVMAVFTPIPSAEGQKRRKAYSSACDAGAGDDAPGSSGFPPTGRSAQTPEIGKFS